MEDFNDITRMLIEHSKKRGLDVIESRPLCPEELVERIKQFEEFCQYIENLNRFEEESRKSVINICEGYNPNIDNVPVY